MNNGIGMVFPSGQQPYYNVTPDQVVTNQQPISIADYLFYLILNNPKRDKVIQRFTKNKGKWYLPILKDTRLSPQQKFEKIFGIKISDLFLSTANKTLGNIFEDIGHWFSNTFSQQGLNNIQNFLAKFQNNIQNINQGLSYFKNQTPYNPQTQIQIQDKIVSAGFDVQDFVSKYGIFIIGGLLLFMVIKK